MPDGLKLEKGVCQVLFCSSPASIPFAFSPHFWFVINRDGVLSRWEVLWEKRRTNPWGHLYKNDFPPFEGMGVFLPFRKPSWKGEVYSIVEGEPAIRLAECIEKTPETYPYCNNYVVWGPNSTTYIDWVLKAFPELKIKLPWNAIG